MNLLPSKHHRLIESVDIFCNRYFSEDKIKQWCLSRGAPSMVYHHLYSSSFGTYFKPTISEEGKDRFEEQVYIIEQLMRRAGATLPFLSDMLSSVLLSCMRELPNSELALRRLTKSGHALFSEAFSEENAGSDAFAVQTSVTLDGQNPIMNGEKTFVSCGQFSPYTLVMARDAIYGNEDKGISLWLVPVSTLGVSTFPINTIGQSMLSPALIRFDDVPLKDHWRIQTQGKLDNVIKRQYELGRVLVSASSLGLAEASMDDALEYASHHRVKGKRLCNIPQIQEKIADMEIKIRSMRLFVHAAAKAANHADKDFHLNCALMKRFVPRAATEVASESLQIFGGKGYTDASRVSRIWIDCRGNQIAQGADEVMTRIILKFMLSDKKI